MKDLGYERTPAEANLRVEMPDGSLWDVPVQLIADSRDENYADDKEDTIGFIRAGQLDKYEITDWAENNMNWDEVEKSAVPVPQKARVIDFQDGWCNGKKKIVGKI